MGRLTIGFGITAFVLVGCGGSSSPGASDVVKDRGDVPRYDTFIVNDPGSLADGVAELPPEEGVEAFDPGADTGSGFTPCTTGEECESGLCINAPDGSGKICPPPCTDSCPFEGWDCVQVVNAGVDVIFVCMPRTERLCRPCEYHEDCWPAPGVDTGDRCVDHLAAGKFCGRDCSKKPCPEGYSCKTLAPGRAGEAAAVQCVPTVGECQCSEYFIQNQFKTSCYVLNENGKCTGKRLCTAGGLTPCDAKTPEPETCDGQDQNCDGQTDEGILLGECVKTFGTATCKGPNVCEGGQIVCKASEPGPEKCDGIDNDCDGTTDPEGTEGCAKYYVDNDGDSYGAGGSRCLCAADGPYAALVTGDCDDGDKEANPGAKEACNGKDDDCDGQVDEPDAIGCADFFKDGDGDGYGVIGDKKCLCGALGEFAAKQTGDCDDGNATVHPGVQEACNGLDDDCDGVKDGQNAAGCVMYYYDNDSDGWGVEAGAQCLCGPTGKLTATTKGDCDDNDPKTSGGGSPEICDSKDNNCNGQIDEPGAQGCTVYYADKDSDGSGNGSDSQCLCGPKFPYLVTQPGDCDDSDPNARPGAAEKCNAKDDDCNGIVDDDGASGCKTYYLDGDGDGWGVSANSRCLCKATAPYTATQVGDCNDASGKTYPAAPEICDNQDNDCDGEIDEGQGGSGCTTWYYDGDGDGYGVSGNSKCACKADGKYSATQSGDCNDNDAGVRPGVPEACNSKDDNCDGSIDEGEGAGGCTPYYFDGDSDGFGVDWNTKCYCKATGSYKATKGGDCDDSNSAIKPSASDTCDGIDNDCDGQTDEGFDAEDFENWVNGVKQGTFHQDLPNNWFGPTVAWCTSDSCSGTFSGRLLPQGDEDWLAVFKKETKSNIWENDLYGQVTFKAAAGKNYKICCCWTQTNRCDQAAEQCQVSTAGAQVVIKVMNDDDYGGNDDSYFEIHISPVNAGTDYSCGQYSITWSVWE